MLVVEVREVRGSLVLVAPQGTIDHETKGDICLFHSFPQVLPQTQFSDVYPSLLPFAGLLRTTPVQSDEAGVNGI